jgi:hypothetical protein
VSSKKLTCSEPIRKPVLTQVGGIRDWSHLLVSNRTAANTLYI